MTTILTGRLIGLAIGLTLCLIIGVYRLARDPKARREILDGINALRFGDLD